jgi:hypothetical protein
MELIYNQRSVAHSRSISPLCRLAVGGGAVYSLPAMTKCQFVEQTVRVRIIILLSNVLKFLLDTIEKIP